MKHLIIGSGVIGKATGIWLSTNKETVFFNDINNKILKELKEQRFKTTKKIIDADVYWICTAEWNTEDAISSLKNIKKDSIVVVRSTTEPGTMEKLQIKYKNLNLIHNPEFLVQNNAIFDIFNPDRIILGATKKEKMEVIEELYKKAVNCPIIKTDFTTSEMIKLTANCWLATQISYWNEIKAICDKLKIKPQEVSNAVTLDKRISKYGSIMMGKQFSGFCLPKDTKAMKTLFKKNKIISYMINSTIKVNRKME